MSFAMRLIAEMIAGCFGGAIAGVTEAPGVRPGREVN